MVRLIDFVYAKSLVGESLHDVIEAFEVFVLEEQTGSGGDFGFDLAAPDFALPVMARVPGGRSRRGPR